MKRIILNKKILPAAFMAVFALGGTAYAGDGDMDSPEQAEKNIFRNTDSENRQKMERAIERNQEMRENMMVNDVRTMDNDVKVMNSPVQAPTLDLTPAQAREIAREANMLGRPALPAQYQGKIVRGYFFDTNSNIVREVVSEPLKSRLPHYDGYDWLIVGQDLVLVDNNNNVVTEVLTGVFE